MVILRTVLKFFGQMAGTLGWAEAAWLASLCVRAVFETTVIVAYALLERFLQIEAGPRPLHGSPFG